MSKDKEDNHAVVNLFCKYICKYKFEFFLNRFTSSFQSDLVEKAQCTIATSTKALLTFGTAQDVKFWLYAFNYDIWTTNALSHQDQARHDSSFCLQLEDGDLLWCTCVSNIKYIVTSCAVKSFCDIKSSQRKLHSAYINHININPIFSTRQATKKLRSLYDQLFQDKVEGVSLYDQFLQDKDQGMVGREFSFHFTFVGKKPKHAIDDYHLLIPRTTKIIKSKVVHDDDVNNNINSNLYSLERSHQ